MKRSGFELNWSTSSFSEVCRGFTEEIWRNWGGGGREWEGRAGGVPDSDESPTLISYIRLAQTAEGRSDWFLRGHVIEKLKQRLGHASLHFSLFLSMYNFLNSHWDNGPRQGKYCRGKYRGNDAKSNKQGCLIVAENKAFCQIEWHCMCKLRHALRNNSVQLFLNTVVRWNFIQCFHICLFPSSSFKNVVFSFVGYFVKARIVWSAKSRVVVRHKII